MTLRKLPFDCQKIAKNLTFFSKKMRKIFIFSKNCHWHSQSVGKTHYIVCMRYKQHDNTSHYTHSRTVQFNLHSISHIAWVYNLHYNSHIARKTYIQRKMSHTESKDICEEPIVLWHETYTWYLIHISYAMYTVLTTDLGLSAVW